MSVVGVSIKLLRPAVLTGEMEMKMWDWHWRMTSIESLNH